MDLSDESSDPEEPYSALSTSATSIPPPVNVVGTPTRPPRSIPSLGKHPQVALPLLR